MGKENKEIGLVRGALKKLEEANSLLKKLSDMTDSNGERAEIASIGLSLTKIRSDLLSMYIGRIFSDDNDDIQDK